MTPSETPVFILSGGLGKRLREVVSDRPKTMADVGGKPFVEILIDYYRAHDFKKFVLLAGYMAETVEEYFASDNNIQVVVESEPLGTGGAIWNAASVVDCETFICLNGDCFIGMNPKTLLSRHFELGPKYASIALVEVPDMSAFGEVRFSTDLTVDQFLEKNPNSHHPGWINAGAYCMNRNAILEFRNSGETFSIEKDIFPKWQGTPDLKGVPFESTPFLDIGTPESYKKAADFIGSQL